MYFSRETMHRTIINDIFYGICIRVLAKFCIFHAKVSNLKRSNLNTSLVTSVTERCFLIKGFAENRLHATREKRKNEKDPHPLYRRNNTREIILRDGSR